MWWQGLGVAVRKTAPLDWDSGYANFVSLLAGKAMFLKV